MSACGKKYAAYLEMCFSNFLEPSTYKKINIFRSNWNKISLKVQFWTFVFSNTQAYTI